MIHAAMFANEAHPTYRAEQFDMQTGEEGNADHICRESAASGLDDLEDRE